jgi:predicted dehydrogenase
VSGLQIREASVCVPLPRAGDVRYRYDLAGGALMDTGCYALDVVRLLGGEQPTVVSATARTLRADRRVDRAVTAELAFPGGATGGVQASIWSRRVLSITVRVLGGRGTLQVTNFLMPQVFHRLRVRTAGGSRSERVPGEATYTAQLRAFRAAVLDGAPVPTSAREAVATASLIDEVYRAAGLPLRTGRPA